MWRSRVIGVIECLPIITSNFILNILKTKLESIGWTVLTSRCRLLPILKIKRTFLIVVRIPYHQLNAVLTFLEKFFSEFRSLQAVSKIAIFPGNGFVGNGKINWIKRTETIFREFGQWLPKFWITGIRLYTTSSNVFNSSQKM